MAEPTAPTAADATDWSLLRRVWPFIRPDRRWFWLVFTMTPLGVLAGVFQPVLLKEGIDEHIAHGDADGLAVVAGLYLACVVIGWIAGSLGFWALQFISLRGLARIRSAVFHHITGQGARFFDRRTTGSLMTRTINDVEAVYESLARGAVALMTDLLTIVGLLITMFIFDWRLTLVAFALSPLIWVAVGWFRRRLRVVSLTIRKSLSRLNGFFAEQIYGMRLVKTYGAEEKAQTIFDTTGREYMTAYHRSNWLDAGLYAVMDGMAALAIGAVVWFAALQPMGLEAVDGAVTTGLVIAFVDILQKIFIPIREFSARIATIQRSIAALERIFSLLDANDKVAPGTIEPDTIVGHVQFDHVSFRYADDRPLVLHDIGFEVQPGEVVALVGATGSGKTTIGKLLMRMYDGYEGSIRVDGHELRDIALGPLRKHVSVVHQDVYLFDGSIADNVTLGDPAIDRETVERATKASRADTFIQGRPDGLDDHLSERGSNLSTGERQLLAISRTMARPASIVILDEATASVDSVTERLIDEAVAELFSQRTVIVIAHRLSTIRKADRILVLHHGRLVEQGNHDALMAAGGRYKVLVETGFAL